MFAAVQSGGAWTDGRESTGETVVQGWSRLSDQAGNFREGMGFMVIILEESCFW